MLNSAADNQTVTMGSDENSPRLFQKGNKLSRGRPKGARQKLTERYLSDIHKAWRRRGPAAIEAAIVTDPMGFVRVMASLVPKDVKITADASEPFLDALRMIQDMQAKPEAIAHPSDNARVVEHVGVDLVVHGDDTIDNDEQDQ